VIVVDWILFAAVVLAAIPLLVLSLECLASLLPPRRPQFSEGRPPCVVLVPAHDEESGIPATIANVQSQLADGDRLVVIADNCTDTTATVARKAGAEVLERADPDRRGKGFALDFGLKSLEADPPQMVVVVDADCELAPGALDRLVRQAAATNRPAQGIYTIGTGRETDARRRLSAFAVVLKNQIRPMGLDRLGCPVLLTGTGMAFPWDAIRQAHLGTGNIVEDMKLGVDLTFVNYAPRLCGSARLSGSAAPDRGSAIRQRTRWEHGHVSTLLTQCPRLMVSGLVRGDVQKVALGLELSVPPLSLLGLGWFGLISLCAIWWQGLQGSILPLTVGCCALTGTAGAFLAAWWVHGRRVLPLKSLLTAPGYVLWKLPIYLKLFVAKEKRWVRTERKLPEES
jgi:cellulose synthase/poly-beta-1,6-N-acetylglucosamine synthase-like glycosyltransferase